MCAFFFKAHIAYRHLKYRRLYEWTNCLRKKHEKSNWHLKCDARILLLYLLMVVTFSRNVHVGYEAVFMIFSTLKMTLDIILGK